MEVTIKLFAQARELANTQELVLDVPSGISLARLSEIMTEHYPALRGMPARWAVDLELVSDDHRVLRNEELAWIPPVSGG